jgi:hypothetical protein
VRPRSAQRPCHLVGGVAAQQQPVVAGAAHLEEAAEQGAVHGLAGRRRDARLRHLAQQRVDGVVRRRRPAFLGHARPFLRDHHPDVAAQRLAQPGHVGGGDGGAELVGRKQPVALGQDRPLGLPLALPDVVGEEAGQQREQHRQHAGVGRHDAGEALCPRAGGAAEAEPVDGGGHRREAGGQHQEDRSGGKVEPSADQDHG